MSHGILHPSRCGKLTHVVIDVHEASYTIPFTACDGNTLGCSCQNPDEDLVITNAYLSSDNAVYNLSHEAETIDVSCNSALVSSPAPPSGWDEKEKKNSSPFRATQKEGLRMRLIQDYLSLPFKKLESWYYSRMPHA